MPSLNNYNTRSQMELDIPVCRTIKGQKSMSFLGLKIQNKLSSNIKAAATRACFMCRLKKEVLTMQQESNFIDFLLFCLSIYLFS